MRHAGPKNIARQKTLAELRKKKLARWHISPKLLSAVNRRARVPKIVNGGRYLKPRMRRQRGRGGDMMLRLRVGGCNGSTVGSFTKFIPVPPKIDREYLREVFTS